jgi:hypothetical protein
MNREGPRDRPVADWLSPTSRAAAASDEILQQQQKKYSSTITYSFLLQR